MEGCIVPTSAASSCDPFAALLLQLLTSAIGASLSLNGSQALQCGRALDAIWHASGPPAARDSRTADTLELATASEYQLASTCARCVLVLLRLHEIGAAAWCSIDLQLVHGLLAVAVRSPSATRVSLHDSLRPSLCDRADEDDDDHLHALLHHGVWPLGIIAALSSCELTPRDRDGASIACATSIASSAAEILQRQADVPSGSLRVQVQAFCGLSSPSPGQKMSESQPADSSVVQKKYTVPFLLLPSFWL